MRLPPRWRTLRQRYTTLNCILVLFYHYLLGLHSASDIHQQARREGPMARGCTSSVIIAVAFVTSWCWVETGASPARGHGRFGRTDDDRGKDRGRERGALGCARSRHRRRRATADHHD